jgi:hypothetical protein
MLGFAKHGQGVGSAPVGYVTAGIDDAALAYLVGKSRRGKARNPAPVVVRGDPKLTLRLIDSIPFVWRYSSGVLSFAPGEMVTPEAEAKILDRFESVAFAGLPHDHYNLLAVRHTHAGHHEVHFIAPRIDLATGKSLNIAPPGKPTRELFDTFRRLTNDEFGFSDPDDPARARMIRVPSYIAKGAATRADLRATITAFLQEKVSAGLIKNREDLLRSLREAGCTISRAGEDYVTVVDPSTNKRCRLKGRLFDKDFSPASPVPQSVGHKLSPDARAKLEARLAQLTTARAEYNRKRYITPAPELEVEPLTPTSTAILSPYYDRNREFIDRRLAGRDERLDRTRECFGEALGRFGDATDRWRDTAPDLEDANLIACDASQRFEQATREFECQSFPRLQTRAVTKMILKKYARGLNSGRDALELEGDLEMEMGR